jgi:acetyl esterase
MRVKTETFLTPSVSSLLRTLGPLPPASSLTPQAQRDGLNAAMAALGWSAIPDVETTLQLASGARVHLFFPDLDARLPVIVYLHGGGFVAGGLAGHGGACRMLADTSGCAVALVEYRLAPEYPAPAALDDAVATIQALRAALPHPRLDTSRIALFGDSAGGCLAAGAALVLRDHGAGVKLLALMNPMVSPTALTSSKREFSSGYFASSSDFDDGWQHYYNHASNDMWGCFDLSKTDALAGLPPTYLWSNEADPVRDEGEAFGERLSAAGNLVVQMRLRGFVHASWLLGRAIPEAHLLMRVIAGTLRAGLV